MRLIKGHWPLLAGIGLLWAMVGLALAQVIHLTDGRLSYALDDPYIHMSVARNYAEFGVWGVTRYEFSSSTSSLLWPLLLALDYAILGVNEISPFILNILFATLTLVAAYRFLPLRSGVRMLLVLAAIVVFTPLPAMIFTGMEHTLHAWVVLVFCGLAAREITTPQPKGRLWLGLWAGIACSVRYESAFFVLAACALLAMRRRFVDAVIVGIMGILPIAVYGLISMSQGWWFFPNPLYLKTASFTLEDKLEQVIFTMGTTPYLWILVLVGAIWVVRRDGLEWSAPSVFLALAAAGTMLHLMLARTGWFYRYEAYLVAVGITAAAAGITRIKLGRIRMAFLSLALIASPLAAFTLFTRAARSFTEIPLAATNIYEQQYQMGLFLREFYQGERVVANDIGAINFLADIHNLDIYGLGSLDVMRAKREERYNVAEVSRLSADSQIAIVYDAWLEDAGGVPPAWTLVGQWTIPHNVAAAYDTISFYAIQQDEAEALTEHLQAFSARLPVEVTHVIAAR